MPTYCIPDLSSVPGSSGDFDWWSVSPPDPTGANTSNPDPTVIPKNPIKFYPDNPDWLGAFSLSEGAGANRDMQFRVLKGTVGGQAYLFLSWVIRTASLDSSSDRVNFLLSDGSQYVAVQVSLGSASNRVAGTENDQIFGYRIRNCTATSGVISVGADPGDSVPLETTGRMWVDVTSPGRGLHTKWAFQVAIPLGKAWAPSTLTLPVSGAFKFWYEVWASLPNATVHYQVPTTPANIHTAGILQIIPPGLNVAHMMDMSTGGTCDQAVTISYSGVGVRNVDPVNDPARSSQYEIRLDLGKNYPPNTANYDVNHTPDVSSTKFQNQFFAQPTVTGLSTVQQNSIRARFSLANWGSQISVPTASSWRPVPNGNDVQYINTQGEAHFVWPVTADTYTTTLVQNINKYLNAVGLGNPIPASAQNPHQCMLVELSSTDPSVVITRSSIYVNMDITRASVARAPARISIEGLAPVSALSRDVYLYLQTFNMPKQVPDEGDGGGEGGDLNRTFAKGAVFDSVRTGHGEGNYDYEVEDVAAFYPTYVVHVYHDSGEMFELADGRKVPILRPQTAFGYFVQHEGPLYGWETRIYNAEKITNDFYRLRVPNNGASYVETAIQARESANEPPLPDDGLKGCAAVVAWLEGLGLIGKIIAMLLKPICNRLGDKWWIFILVLFILLFFLF